MIKKYIRSAAAEISDHFYKTEKHRKRMQINMTTLLSVLQSGVADKRWITIVLKLSPAARCITSDFRLQAAGIH